MKRTLNAEYLNTVLNHPEVHRWLGVEGAVDVTSVVQNPDNFTLEAEGGAFLACLIQDGVYEVHSQFLPEVRGTLGPIVKECLDYMFLKTDCHTLMTQLPDNNLPAIALATRVGFKPIFRRETTTRGPTAYARYTLDEWVHSNFELEATGERFHEALEECKQDTHSILPTHPHDPAHDRAVGAAIQMVKAGNAVKGVDYYNGWAKLAGYAPVTLVSLNPVVVDLIDAVVEHKDGHMEILLCR